MIGVIDYGMGNVGSIVNMVKKAGGQSTLLSSPDALSRVDKVILPGVGAFDNAVERLTALGFFPAIREHAAKKKPTLGVCLGMQLLGTGSEEGSLKGLELIPGFSRRFPAEQSLKVPHMGWNRVRAKGDNALLTELQENKFYFVHSYHFVPDREEWAAGITDYGQPFVSMIHRDGVWGTQFHPEKSHRYGLQLFTNFLAL